MQKQQCKIPKNMENQGNIRSPNSTTVLHQKNTDMEINDSPNMKVKIAVLRNLDDLQDNTEPCALLVGM